MYRWLWLPGVFLVLAFPIGAAATPPLATLGTAIVDGQFTEWNLTGDYFADMYLAGDKDAPAESRLYLRYDNVHGILYALVLCSPMVTGYDDRSAGTAWIVLDGQNPKAVDQRSVDDGAPPDFAWIALGYDGNPQHIRGYEASLWMLPGDHIIVAQVGILNPADGAPAISSIPAGGADISIPVSAVRTESASFGSSLALYR